MPGFWTTRMMGLGVLVAAALAPTSAGAAGMAAITAVAPVEDDASEEGVKAAAESALVRAVRGAQAMGHDDVTLKSIRMVPGTGVVVEILATDAGPEAEDSASAPEPAPAGAPRL
jgi:hypothetical protein